MSSQRNLGLFQKFFSEVREEAFTPFFFKREVLSQFTPQLNITCWGNRYDSKEILVKEGACKRSLFCKHTLLTACSQKCLILQKNHIPFQRKYCKITNFNSSW